jgi:superfamily II DNA or RNA helicase
MYVYVIHSEFTDKNSLKKLGLTIHPVHRMRQYDIGDAPGVGLEKRYEGLWLVNAKNRQELHDIEAALHTHFANCRQPRENGRSSEWFRVTFQEVLDYMITNPHVIRRISADEITTIEQQIRTTRTRDDRIAEREERELIEAQDDSLFEPEILTLKQKFLNTFLPGKQFRRNQDELWKELEILSTRELTEIYRGIIQWPTGTGKTYALLMIIVILADKYSKQGHIFRGLLVAPKNDIFNTIIHHIHKLSEFGITVCEGHNGLLSSLHIPPNQSILVTACHAGLTNTDMIMRLPPMNLVHYDEVHRIGGDEFFELLKGRLLAWKTEFLTGTSATPRTANPAQHRKISELFGDPYTLLHKCDIDDAIAEEWIAQPRFSIHIVSKNKERADLIRQFLNIVRQCIENKKEIGNWKGGKVIVYLPLREEVREAVRLASTVFPSEWKIFRAVEDMSVADDKEFVNEPADGLPRILFACERYREGSDITGIEMTGILMGNTIAANILIQIIGRALRADYKGKEGWCCIFRPSEEGTTEEDVLDQILLEITEILGRNDLPMTPKEIRRMVETFFGDTTVRDKLFSIEETVARVQAIYERREYQRNPCAETIRRQCIVRNITHTSEYNNVKEEMGWATAPWERMDLTPYAFFHPETNPICERTVLTNLLRAQNIYTTEAYKTWRTEQIELYPSVEDINDGYFRGTVNLQDILPQGNRRR